MIFFACMVRLLLLMVVFWPVYGFSQDFLSNQERVFRDAQSQWLCVELEQINSQYFQCNPSQVSWKLPNDPTLLFFQQPIALNDSMRSSFAALLFPNNECSRYLKLLSLCDLYFPLFKRKLESAGLPKEYMYLPVMLSGLNNKARSSMNRGGMWALEYLVARKYGLRIDSVVDERNGGDFTTDAAIHYLADLSKQFQGDAIKVVTAYRKGVPYVVRLMEQPGDQSFYDRLSEDDRLSISFFAYLQSVVSSTVAANQLESYFSILGNYEPVFVDEEISFQAMVELLGITKDALLNPNPVYCGEAIPAQYRKVPFLLDNRYYGKFQSLKDSLIRYQLPIVKKPKSQPRYHVVKKGESLGLIAEKYHTSVGQLKKWNGLRSDIIRPGQRIQVGEKELKSEEDGVKKSQLNESKKTTEPKNNTDSLIYIVKSGDTIWEIAKRYPGVTDADIMRWNQCDAQIKPGQKLIIHKQ